MRTITKTLAVISVIALAGCDTLTPQQQIAAGGLAGAAVGLVTANAINANPSWTVLTVLAGAAAGTLVARNNSTGTCAYSNGDGTYYEAACR